MVFAVRRWVARWAPLVAATALAALAATALGLPSPWLFAALLVGLAYALGTRGQVPHPSRAIVTAGQAIVGVSVGAELKTSTLGALGDHWLSVTLVTVATLAVSLVAGIVLARVTTLDGPTASLGMVAGGASGIVAMSDELGADGRLVAFMQYLRVLVVVLLAPLIVRFGFDAGGGGGPAPGSAGLALALAFTLAASLAGLGLARAVRLPGGSVLGPLAAAAALTASGAVDAQVPSAVQDAAFAIIGLEVGLRFERSTVRLAGRLLPAVLAAIVGLIVACAALAAALAPLAHVSFLDAYLATTPGGLYAVLAAAFGSSADTTFVLAVQTLRLLAMVLAAPALVRLLRRPHGGRATATPTGGGRE